MLTIGELAGFAGVTVRAVRHYHARGLLPEPARDPSGYRRYDAQAVVDLIRIKTLAEAGVPLARVKELLAAAPEQFSAAIENIDRDLEQRIRELGAHRRRIARLAAGDSLALPDQVIRLLDRLRDVGISERTIGIERDGWILISAQLPDQVAEWIAQKQRDLDDPRWCELYVGFDRAFDYEPHDPRLAVLADALVAYATEVYAEVGLAPDGSAGAIEEPLVALLDSQTVEASPGWRQLGVLLEERGWSGWNQVELKTTSS
jgi:DNA-binding transcriptional MerR regulator